MITDILISAAGKGTRMKELTADMPKHMIAVEGRPFLKYLLDNVITAGFTKIYLVVGYKKERIEEFVAQHPEYPVTLIDQHAVLSDKYGTACPVMCAEQYLTGKQFVSIAGDNYYSARDLQVMRTHDDGLTYVGGLKHDHPETMGVLVIRDGNRLERIVEKPAEYLGDLVNTSIYKFTPEVFTVLKTIGLSPRGEYEITDALSYLAKHGKVCVETMQDGWLDFGRPEDIEKMGKLLQAEKE